MSDSDDIKPTPGSGPEPAKQTPKTKADGNHASREDRLAQALRANLKRRKQQLRGRHETQTARPDENGEPEAGS